MPMLGSIPFLRRMWDAYLISFEFFSLIDILIFGLVFGVLKTKLLKERDLRALTLKKLARDLVKHICQGRKGELVCVQVVSPGLHVLTNARLDTPWHKAQVLGESLKEVEE
ncbi:uncharacterized protein LOC120263331 [Dioscorea cayenensis subsp. rotundata]|uniref:Uncharacterized protein LOC120263331 n=1 Tax=Dioscorea cayennensis subsp. rotundata TaxID=55577 RepID=A0AB40BIB2_DIOCR|nr:uncharacterized protein LOC120263331 [Dioscorea cayenensis subsp. rotundata]